MYEMGARTDTAQKNTEEHTPRPRDTDGHRQTEGLSDTNGDRQTKTNADTHRELDKHTNKNSVIAVSVSLHATLCHLNTEKKEL